MAVDFNDIDFDPVTGKSRKKPAIPGTQPYQQPNLPYFNPNQAQTGQNQILPYVGPKVPTNQPANYTPQNTAQANTNVMGAAQNMALGGTQQGATAAALRSGSAAMTGRLMNDPSMGMNWGQYKNQALSLYDANQAKAAQAAKQQMGGMGGAGQVQAGMVDMLLKQNTGRTELDNQMTQQVYENQMKDYLGALGQARTEAGAQEESEAGALENLLKVRSGYEGERAQESGQSFATSERQATQAWQTSERVDQNTFTGAQADLDRIADKAKFEGNVALTKWVEEQRAGLALKMQTNDMTHDEKMAYLGANLAEAKANNDVGRQKQILSFQHSQNIDMLTREQGHDKAMAYLDNEFQIAKDSRDFVAQESLIKTKAKLEAEERAKDRQIEQVLADAKISDMQYNRLWEQFKAGTITIDGVMGELKKYLPAGYELQAPDPNEWKQSIDQEFDQQEYQWAKMNQNDPIMVTVGPDGKPTLTEAGKSAFLTHFQDTVLGSPDTTQYITGEKLYNELIGKVNDAAYKALLKNSVDITGSMSIQSTWQNDGKSIWRINGIPPAKSYVTIDGKLYYYDGNRSKTAHADGFYLIDLENGQKAVLGANESLAHTNFNTPSITLTDGTKMRVGQNRSKG